MLTYKKLFKDFNLICITLLLIISVFAFQNPVYSNEDLNETAEEYRALGYEAQQKGDFQKALSFYSKAIVLGLDNPIVLNDIGVLYEQLGLSQKAEDNYLTAIAVDKTYLPSYMNLAYLYKTSGNMDEAYKFFKLRYELGDIEDPWADKAKMEAIDIDPGYVQRSVIIERERKKLRLEAMNNALEKEKQKEFAKLVKMSNGHYKSGMNYFNKGEFNDALMQFNKALELTPRNPKILEARKQALKGQTKKHLERYTEQARMLLDAGDTNSARREIEKMLTTFPK